MSIEGQKIKHKLGRSMNEFERPNKKKKAEGKGEWMGDQDQNKRKEKKNKLAGVSR